MVILGKAHTKNEIWLPKPHDEGETGVSSQTLPVAKWISAPSGIEAQSSYRLGWNSADGKLYNAIAKSGSKKPECLCNTDDGVCMCVSYKQKPSLPDPCSEIDPKPPCCTPMRGEHISSK